MCVLEPCAVTLHVLLLSMLDIDEILEDCAIVNPIGAPNDLEIDIMDDDEGDEELFPVRVSSKGLSALLSA